MEHLSSATMAAPKQRSKLAPMIVIVALVLSSCTLFSKGIYKEVWEWGGARRSVVFVKGIDAFLYQQLWNVGAQTVANGLADQMELGITPIFINLPWPYETAAHYTRHAESDVASAIVAAAGGRECLAFTHFPQYNWTIKGC